MKDVNVNSSSYYGLNIWRFLKRDTYLTRFETWARADKARRAASFPIKLDYFPYRAVEALQTKTGRELGRQYICSTHVSSLFSLFSRIRSVSRKGTAKARRVQAKGWRMGAVTADR